MRRGSAALIVSAVRGALFALALAVPAGEACARGTPDSFAELANQLLPSVVSIATTQTLKAGSDQALADLPPDPELQKLFKDYLDKNKNRPRHVTALGSGFIIDSSGLIVTNNHVVADADEITVTFNDGSTLPAKLVGRDDKTDLALIRVKPKAPLPAAHFGDSDKAHIGDWVIAIGNPFGLGSSVTAGIVSARNRDIAAGPYDDFIQTDAPINRGNSGGPLFDMDGNVIGINSAIFSPSGGSVGVGFAIPSNMARDVVDQLREYGQIRRGWLGVRIQQVTSDIAEGMGLPNSSGALVAEVTPGGPAAKAGVQEGDIITGFDGKPVPDSRTLPRVVADTPIGKTVSIDIVRKGKKDTLRVTVARLEDSDLAPGPLKPARPTPPKLTSKLGQLGVTLAQLDTETRAKFHIDSDVQGAVVTDVDSDSPAAENNLSAGDVIVQVQNEPVHTPEEVVRRVNADAKAGRKVELLLVNRDGNPTYIALRLSEAG